MTDMGYKVSRKGQEPGDFLETYLEIYLGVCSGVVLEEGFLGVGVAEEGAIGGSRREKTRTTNLGKLKNIDF